MKAKEVAVLLKNNLELQQFLQNCQELSLWINDKLLTPQDVSYDDVRNLHNKWQKHREFMAELASHQAQLEIIDAVSKSRGAGLSTQMCSPEWGFRQSIDTVLKLVGRNRTWE